MSTILTRGLRAPVGDEGDLRLLPYRFTRWAIEYLNAVQNRPVCVCLHPWELDRERPMQSSASARARHYLAGAPLFGYTGRGVEVSTASSGFPVSAAWRSSRKRQIHSPIFLRGISFGYRSR